jgi:hypothetical protein
VFFKDKEIGWCAILAIAVAILVFCAVAFHWDVQSLLETNIELLHNFNLFNFIK